MDVIALLAGIRQVIAGERELFRYEFFCDVPPRAIVSYEDISEIKHAEQLLRLENTVARCLADADDISAALQAVIRVCETQR